MAEEDFCHATCRICNITTDGDCIDLLEKNDNTCETLTFSGKLYEELIGLKIQPSEPTHYSKFTCTSCDLQMKLFKQLKERAIKLYQKLELQNGINEENKSIESIDIKEDQQLHQNELFTIVTEEFDQNSNKEKFNFHIENLSNIITDDGNSAEGTEESLFQVESNYTEYGDKPITAENVDSMLIVYDSLGDALEANENLITTNSSLHEKVEKSSITSTFENEFHDSSNFFSVHYSDQKKDQEDLHVLGNTKKMNICKCKECDRVFPTVRMLKQHRQETHPFVNRCNECLKVLRSAEALEVHKKQHLGLPAYSCEECNRTFKQKVHYQYHMKRHNNERNFSCKECEKKFVSKSDLTIHMRQHNGIRPYMCPIENCKKKCYTEQHLKMHMYHHNGTKNFECEICHRKFVSPTVLQTHLKTIHVNRRFECTVCGKKFRRKHHLEVHALTHETVPVISDGTYFLNNMDDCFIDYDVMMEMEEPTHTTYEFNYEQFIEVNGFEKSGLEATSDNELF